MYVDLNILVMKNKMFEKLALVWVLFQFITEFQVSAITYSFFDITSLPYLLVIYRVFIFNYYYFNIIMFILILINMAGKN